MSERRNKVNFNFVIGDASSVFDFNGFVYTLAPVTA